MSRPRGFSDSELATLAVCFVAVGRWTDAGLTEDEGRYLVMRFFECLTNDPAKALRASYLSLQNTFMAMRKDTFEQIQKEPAFSRSGRKKIKRLLRAWLDSGNEEFEALWKQIFNSCFTTIPESPVSIIANSGESEEQAIRIITSDPEERVNAEYWWLYYEYGRGWERGLQLLTRPDSKGRRFDILNIEFQDGQTKRLYFEC
jgi:hypothetical protein